MIKLNFTNILALSVAIQLIAALAHKNENQNSPDNIVSEFTKTSDQLDAKEIILKSNLDHFLNNNPMNEIFKNKPLKNSPEHQGFNKGSPVVHESVGGFTSHPLDRLQDTLHLNQSDDHQIQSKTGRLLAHLWTNGPSENTLEKNVPENLSDAKASENERSIDKSSIHNNLLSNNQNTPFSKISFKKLLSEKNPSKLFAAFLSSSPTKELLEKFLDRLMREGDRLMKDLETNWNSTSENGAASAGVSANGGFSYGSLTSMAGSVTSGVTEKQTQLFAGNMTILIIFMIIM